MKTVERNKRLALRLLREVNEIPTTEVTGYVYGNKKLKSTMSQKKSGRSPMLHGESMRIIEFYLGVANKIDKLLR
jgi:hypothetical protein